MTFTPAELRDAVDELLCDAERWSGEIPGGVNWANLSVCDVIREVSLLTGDTALIVLVEEASSEAGGWMTKRLAERLPSDHEPVTVRCEW